MSDSRLIDRILGNLGDEGTDAKPRVIIIGAGASGLAALGAFRRQGFRDVLLLEKATAVGGVWQSCRYPNLAIHSQSFKYKFYNFPPPASVTQHATQREMLEYFARYIANGELDKHILLGYKVERISIVEKSETSHICEVTVRRLSDKKEYLLTCAYVICALGFSNAGTPNIPEFVGEDTFSGCKLHSSQFTAEALESIKNTGKRVCIVGAGKSAYDIALQFVRNDLAKSTTWIYRKFLWGFNYDILYSSDPVERAKLSKMYHCFHAIRVNPTAPETIRRIEEVISDRTLLSLEKNLSIHEMRGAIYRPNDLNLLNAEVNRIASPIERIEGRTLHLQDGQTLLCDYLICCTGYMRARNIPLIELRTADGRQTRIDPRQQNLLYRGMIDVRLPKIVLFTGEVIFGQQLYGFSIAAEWAAHYVQRTNRTKASTDEMNKALELDDSVLNGGVSSDFIYSWVPRNTLSGGYDYLIGFAASRYFGQIFTDLGVESALLERLYMESWDPTKFEEISELITKQLIAAVPSQGP